MLPRRLSFVVPGAGFRPFVFHLSVEEPFVALTEAGTKGVSSSYLFNSLCLSSLSTLLLSRRTLFWSLYSGPFAFHISFQRREPFSTYRSEHKGVSASLSFLFNSFSLQQSRLSLFLSFPLLPLFSSPPSRPSRGSASQLSRSAPSRSSPKLSSGPPELRRFCQRRRKPQS